MPQYCESSAGNANDLKMEMSNDEQERELLLHSQAHIWNHIWNLVNSLSLKCAVQLGIPDIINKHGRPMALSELVATLPINPAKAYFVSRLMRILVHTGFFTKEIKVSENSKEEGITEGYLLTPASRLLLKDEPFSETTYLLTMLDPIMTKPWHHMSEWFQNDDTTAFETAYGSSVWDYFGSHVPRLSHSFNEAMASDSRLVASMVVRDSNRFFEGLNSLVDVGGGTGTMAKAIADAFPNMKCTVLDLPHVVAELKGSKNLNFVGGDMFESIPSADAILLKWILHDWSDEECGKILKHCKEAIQSKGGKVIIIEMLVEDNQNKNGDQNHESSIETQLFFDMVMMTMVTGRERTEKEWAELFLAAGFRDYKITPILGLRSVIEVYP